MPKTYKPGDWVQGRTVRVELDVKGADIANAVRAETLREVAGGSARDERLCPVQDKHITAIPWGLAEILHNVYRTGHGQSLEQIAERGGFGRRELGSLAVGMYGHEGRRPMRGYETRMPILDLYRAATTPNPEDGECR